MFTKPQSLQSALEKLAYQGQCASHMGLIINVYQQQALGNLLSTLQEKEVNIDLAIQCCRDSFAMSSWAHAGALHHLVCMADTGLADIKDVCTPIRNLPLSHEGVFGEGIQVKLNERQEMNKQIADLLPEQKYKRKLLDSLVIIRRLK